MANLKISQLTAGAPAQATDLLPIDRAGANYSLQVSDIGSQILTSPNVSNSITTGINALGNVTGATNVDLSLGNVISMTLTGNATLTLINAVAAAGEEVTFIITQNGTGGNVITWPVVVPAGVAPYASLGAGSVSVFKAIVDGNGKLNFAANGPVTVFRSTTPSVTTSNVSNEAIYTPAVIGRYRMTVIVSCVTIGTTATMQVQGMVGSGNQRNPSAGTLATACACTGLYNTQSVVVAWYAYNTTNTIGWISTLTNAIGAAVFQVDFIVEYLGT
jgi:hypothetical protein